MSDIEFYAPRDIDYERPRMPRKGDRLLVGGKVVGVLGEPIVSKESPVSITVMVTPPTRVEYELAE